MLVRTERSNRCLVQIEIVGDTTSRFASQRFPRHRSREKRHYNCFTVKDSPKKEFSLEHVAKELRKPLFPPIHTAGVLLCAAIVGFLLWTTRDMHAIPLMIAPVFYVMAVVLGTLKRRYMFLKQALINALPAEKRGELAELLLRH